MAGFDFRAEAPLIIKVHKRSFASLGDTTGDEQSGEPPRILCDPFGKPVFYGRLIAGNDPLARETGFNAGRTSSFDHLQSKDASPDALRVEALLQDIRDDRIKRPRVEAVVAKKVSLPEPVLGDDGGRDPTSPVAPHEEEYIYYVKTDSPDISNPQLIALINVSQLILEEGCEDEMSDQWEDDEDSNAEDYYKNDYPDEESDNDRHYRMDNDEDDYGGDGAPSYYTERGRQRVTGYAYAYGYDEEEERDDE